MVFTGPLGVGETEIARVLGGIYRDLGVLSSGHLIETDRAGLVAGYVGQTAARTLEVCKSALDRVLLIDEAYSLAGEGNDFGREAIDTLLKFTEDNRARLAQAQGFTLPATTPALLAPWLEERMPHEDWSNGREMRSLLERIREAQALRISAQDARDLNALTEQDLTAALSVQRV